MTAQSGGPQGAATKGGRCRLRRRECAGGADERWGCQLRKTVIGGIASYITVSYSFNSEPK